MSAITLRDGLFTRRLPPPDPHNFFGVALLLALLFITFLLSQI